MQHIMLRTFTRRPECRVHVSCCTCHAQCLQRGTLGVRAPVHHAHFALPRSALSHPGVISSAVLMQDDVDPSGRQPHVAGAHHQRSLRRAPCHRNARVLALDTPLRTDAAPEGIAGAAAGAAAARLPVPPRCVRAG